MPLQILSLKLDGITAGDYLTWCRDPEPPALDFALRSVSVDADPLGDTITAGSRGDGGYSASSSFVSITERIGK